MLSKLNVFKSSLSDVIDNRLLKNLADILAAPICALINNSLTQGVVPAQWKLARVSPIPKCVPVRDIVSDLRPISITCPVSKVTEVSVSKLFDYFDFLMMTMILANSVLLQEDQLRWHLSD